MTYPLARSPRMRLDAFARAAGLHPELVRRLVALGLLEPVADAAGELWFASTDVARAARIQRLRTGLTLNYAAVGLVLDLLARIEQLESALRTRPRTPQEARPWRSTA